MFSIEGSSSATPLNVAAQLADPLGHLVSPNKRIICTFRSRIKYMNRSHNNLCTKDQSYTPTSSNKSGAVAVSRIYLSINKLIRISIPQSTRR